MENIATGDINRDVGRKIGVGKFGKVGLDVGRFGRWSRLLWGIALLLPLLVGAVQDLQGSGHSLSFYGVAGFYFLGICAAYIFVYWSLGEQIFARANPWFNTAIFVGPAFVAGWWEMLFGPLTGTSLPSSLPFAMTAYIGVSFILQWKIRYGGCEVVALPIILSRRRYTTYCIPLVALDAAEKVVVDRLAGRGDSRSK